MRGTSFRHHLPGLFTLAVHLVGVVFLAQATGQIVAMRQAGGMSELLLTEFQYDPPGLDREREWVEIANLGERALQLAHFRLGDEARRGGGEGMLRFPEESWIEAGGVRIVAQTAAGFRSLYGFDPDYEIENTDNAVPDMLIDEQWATGQFALANDGDEILLLDDSGKVVDALNYGAAVTYFAPSIPTTAPGQSVERAPAVCDSNSAVDWRAQTAPTPGTLQLSGECLLPSPAPASSGQFMPIGQIQGNGFTSPLLNQEVAFQGIVTGVLEDQNAAGVVFYTLFVQDLLDRVDGDPATSDAVAVFHGRQRPFAQAGDLVTVSGQVTEFYGLTEIDDYGLDLNVVASGHSLPEPEPVAIPVHPGDAAAYLEALEGMLVASGQRLPVVGPTHSGCGFAVAARPDQSRPVRHSERDQLAPPILVLHHSDVDCSDLPGLKSGDLVGGIEGPLTYHFDRYKVVQQRSETLRIERARLNSLPAMPQASAEWFRVATLNLNNYLSPAADDEAQRDGLPTAADLVIKQGKLAATIGELLHCPELFAVQEIESKELLLELVEAIASECPFPYRISHLDSPDARGIDVALLTDPRRVTIARVRLRQVCSPVPTDIFDEAAPCAEQEAPLFSRPPLEVKLFVDHEPLTLFINHFKSKREGAAETEARRLAQAEHVHALVREMLASHPEEAVIVLGDFNDYDHSEAWRTLQRDGILYDALQRIPTAERYSYIFDGEAQLLDGILLSPALVHRLEAAAVAHVNADFPVTMEVEVDPQTRFLRSSDHDPVLVAISSTSPQPPIVKSAIALPSSADTLPLTTATAAAIPGSPPEEDGDAHKEDSDATPIAGRPATAVSTEGAAERAPLAAGRGEEANLPALRASLLPAALLLLVVAAGAYFFLRKAR